MVQIKLNQQWILKDLGWDKEYPVSLPASVMNTLLEHKEIEDPFYRDNEDKALKIAQGDYLFYKKFRVDQHLLDREYITIKFHGIDTIAEISLNGKKFAQTQNMHRIFEWDIKPLLQEGENRIEVMLFSPVTYVEQKQAEDQLIGVPHALEGYQHLRKAHSMFGWDWGPKIPDLGIWRDVEIRAWDTNRIQDIHIQQFHYEHEVKLAVEVQQEENRQWLETYIHIKDPQGKLIQEAKIDEAANQVQFTMEEPQLWWPAGYGEQPLYTVEVFLKQETETVESACKRIGLRTIEVKHETDEWGKSFAFIVNGYPVFMKGANYIPEDNLLPRTSKSRTERLISDSVKANFNMLRVWGGGHYPEDYFYDLCDQYGLVVWQDFMYACSAYRVTDSFADNVCKEAIDQIKRLRHHASLGIWCGNNEVEEAMEYWGWPNKPDWRRDYIKLFEIMLPEIVKTHDPQTFYWSSSPSSGGGFDEPRNPDRGDMHYWEVWHGQKPFTEYRNYYFRFCSEFGFQSFPAMKTIESFTEKEDRNIFSRVMEKHQKNDAANGKILYYLSENFLYPKDLDSLVYTSQLLQAEAIKYGVEHWRRNLGRCMGSLYWQLNDCWPVASWSSIDYYGRWKALHYYAKKFYDPVLLSIEEGENDATIYVTNDKLTLIEGRLEWKLRDNHSSILREGTLGFVVESLTAKSCTHLDFRDVMNEETRYRTYLEVTLYMEDKEYSRATVIFSKPKHFDFLDPALGFEIKEDDEEFQIIVRSATFTKYVELQMELDVIFSDNFFDLSAGETKTVTLDKESLDTTFTKADIANQLQLRSVYHITK